MHTVLTFRILIVAVLLAVVVAGLAAVPATAQGSQGLIAFENRYDEDNALDRIEVMHPDGSERRVLVEDAVDAALSPDGSRLAFQRDGDIWVLDVASGVESVVGGAPASESAPAWSADGSLLAFARGVPPGADCSHLFNTEIVITDFAGEGQLTDTDCLSEGQPDFAPDGTRLVFQNFFVEADFSDGLSFLAVADLEDGSIQVVTDASEDRDAYNPSWSPDGSRIAFDDFVDTYTVAATGGTSTALSASPEDCASREPDWAPDGSALAVTLQCSGAAA